ncbi:hypothetical protein AABC07_29580, partial [Streptomyces sp. LNU-CPARS28]
MTGTGRGELEGTVRVSEIPAKATGSTRPAARSGGALPARPVPGAGGGPLSSAPTGTTDVVTGAPGTADAARGGARVAAGEGAGH